MLSPIGLGTSGVNHKAVRGGRQDNISKAHFLANDRAHFIAYTGIGRQPRVLLPSPAHSVIAQDGTGADDDEASEASEDGFGDGGDDGDADLVPTATPTRAVDTGTVKAKQLEVAAPKDAAEAYAALERILGTDPMAASKPRRTTGVSGSAAPATATSGAGAAASADDEVGNGNPPAHRAKHSGERGRWQDFTGSPIKGAAAPLTVDTAPESGDHDGPGLTSPPRRRSLARVDNRRGPDAAKAGAGGVAGSPAQRRAGGLKVTADNLAVNVASFDDAVGATTAGNGRKHRQRDLSFNRDVGEADRQRGMRNAAQHTESVAELVSISYSDARQPQGGAQSAASQTQARARRRSSVSFADAPDAHTATLETATQRHRRSVTHTTVAASSSATHTHSPPVPVVAGSATTTSAIKKILAANEQRAAAGMGRGGTGAEFDAGVSAAQMGAVLPSYITDETLAGLQFDTRRWSTATFRKLRPAGREDVRRVMAWVQHQEDVQPGCANLDTAGSDFHIGDFLDTEADAELLGPPPTAGSLRTVTAASGMGMVPATPSFEASRAVNSTVPVVAAHHRRLSTVEIGQNLESAAAAAAAAEAGIEVNDGARAGAVSAAQSVAHNTALSQAGVGAARGLQSAGFGPGGHLTAAESTSKALAHAQGMYAIALHEIARQEATSCVDRAIALTHVWKGFAATTQSKMSALTREVARIRDGAKRHKARMAAHHEAQLRSMLQERTELADAVLKAEALQVKLRAATLAKEKYVRDKRRQEATDKGGFTGDDDAWEDELVRLSNQLKEAQGERSEAQREVRIAKNKMRDLQDSLDDYEKQVSMQDEELLSTKNQVWKLTEKLRQAQKRTEQLEDVGALDIQRATHTAALTACVKDLQTTLGEMNKDGVLETLRANMLDAGVVFNEAFGEFAVAVTGDEERRRHAAEARKRRAKRRRERVKRLLAERKLRRKAKAARRQARGSDSDATSSSSVSSSSSASSEVSSDSDDSVFDDVDRMVGSKPDDATPMAKGLTHGADHLKLSRTLNALTHADMGRILGATHGFATKWHQLQRVVTGDVPATATQGCQTDHTGDVVVNVVKEDRKEKREALRMPQAWHKLLGKSKHKGKVRLMSLSRLKQLIMDSCIEKIKQDEIDKAQGHPVMELPSFIVAFFLQRYGVRKLVEMRLREILASVEKTPGANLDIRVRRFAGCLGLPGFASVSESLWAFYLRCIEVIMIDLLKVGGRGKQTWVSSQREECPTWIPLRIALKVPFAIFPSDAFHMSNKLSSGIAALDQPRGEDLVDVRAAIGSHETCINLDQFLELLVNAWQRDRVERDKLTWHKVFYDVDVDGSNTLDAEEFLSIMDCVAGVSMNKSRLRTIYMEALQDFDLEFLDLRSFMRVVEKYDLKFDKDEAATGGGDSVGGDSGSVASPSSATSNTSFRVGPAGAARESPVADRTLVSATEAAGASIPKAGARSSGVGARPQSNSGRRASMTKRRGSIGGRNKGAGGRRGSRHGKAISERVSAAVLGMSRAKRTAADIRRRSTGVMMNAKEVNEVVEAAATRFKSVGEGVKLSRVTTAERIRMEDGGLDGVHVTSDLATRLSPPRKLNVLESAAFDEMRSQVVASGRQEILDDLTSAWEELKPEIHLHKVARFHKLAFRVLVQKRIDEIEGLIAKLKDPDTVVTMDRQQLLAQSVLVGSLVKLVSHSWAQQQDAARRSVGKWMHKVARRKARRARAQAILDGDDAAASGSAAAAAP